MNLDSFKTAYHESFQFNDENLKMLATYAGHMKNYYRKKRKLRLLSLGLGHQIVSKAILGDLGKYIAKYVILEGSREIISEFVARNPLPSGAEIIQTYFENYKLNDKFDIVEMGFVLEHVDNPRVILKKFKKHLKTSGRAFIAVPNALSLHRRIGVAAGKLKDPYALSKQDLQLGHQRYYDLKVLTDEVQSCGYRIISSKGLMIKPITTSQLESLQLKPEIYDAFFLVAEAHPDISNAILIEASVK